VSFPVSFCVAGIPGNIKVAGSPPPPALLPAEAGWTLFPAVLGGPPCCWSSIKEFRRRVWPMRMDFRCDLLRWYCPPGVRSSFFACACRSSCHRLLALLGGADGEAWVAGALCAAGAVRATGAEGAEVEAGIAVEAGADEGPDFASSPRRSICPAGAGLRRTGAGGTKEEMECYQPRVWREDSFPVIQHVSTVVIFFDTRSNERTELDTHSVLCGCMLPPVLYLQVLVSK
jgi:hypothetical protein